MQYIRSTRAPFALLALSAVIACSRGDDNRADSALATDTALNRDINLAGADTAAQPQLTDVPATPAATPSTSRPAASRPTTSSSRPSTSSSRPSTPSKPSTSSGGSSSSGSSASGSGTSAANSTVNAGYTVNARSNQKVCTNAIKVGDTFTATVYETVSGTGTASIPNGATVTLRVTQVSRGENVRDDAVLATDVQSITINGRTYTPDATVTYANVDQVRASSKSNDAKKVIGGAIIGAVAGQVLGKDTKSTVTGAAAGAAAGTAAAVATANKNGCINSGARIQFRIDESMIVRSE
jgi:hypothetical protein